MLKKLLRSNATCKVFEYLIKNEYGYIRGIEKDTHICNASIKNVVDIFSNIGIFNKRKSKNKYLYSMNKKYIIYKEIINLFTKAPKHERTTI